MRAEQSQCFSRPSANRALSTFEAVYGLVRIARIERQSDPLADQGRVERHAHVAGHQHGDASNRMGFFELTISSAASSSSSARAAPTACAASGYGFKARTYGASMAAWGPSGLGSMARRTNSTRSPAHVHAPGLPRGVPGGEPCMVLEHSVLIRQRLVVASCMVNWFVPVLSHHTNSRTASLLYCLPSSSGSLAMLLAMRRVICGKPLTVGGCSCSQWCQMPLALALVSRAARPLPLIRLCSIVSL
jgi:hypothetical protein